MFSEEELVKSVRRKIKIENLIRCMNCSVFVTCVEDLKENVVECDHYSEVSKEKQVIVIPLSELNNQPELF